MPDPPTASNPRRRGQDHRLGKRAWSWGSVCRQIPSRTAGRPPGSIGCAVRTPSRTHGCGRYASPGPEKVAAGGVVRGVGSGRSVGPDAKG